MKSSITFIQRNRSPPFLLFVKVNKNSTERKKKSCKRNAHKSDSLSFKIFPLKHKMFCKVKTFNLLHFSTAKYIFRNHQHNSYLKQASRKRIPLSYKILPLSHKMFWKCDIIDILLIHSIKNTSGTSNAHTCQVA